MPTASPRSFRHCNGAGLGAAVEVPGGETQTCLHRLGQLICRLKCAPNTEDTGIKVARSVMEGQGQRLCAGSVCRCSQLIANSPVDQDVALMRVADEDFDDTAGFGSVLVIARDEVRRFAVERAAE